MNRIVHDDVRMMLKVVQYNLYPVNRNDAEYGL
jgi:hypothetical protein